MRAHLLCVYCTHYYHTYSRSSIHMCRQLVSREHLLGECSGYLLLQAVLLTCGFIYCVCTVLVITTDTAGVLSTCADSLWAVNICLESVVVVCCSKRRYSRVGSTIVCVLHVLLPHIQPELYPHVRSVDLHWNNNKNSCVGGLVVGGLYPCNI